MAAPVNGDDIPEHEAIAQKNDQFFEQIYSHEPASDEVRFNKRDLKGSRPRRTLVGSRG